MNDNSQNNVDVGDAPAREIDREAIRRKLAKLAQEEAQINKRRERRQIEAIRDERRRDAIRAERHRLELLPLLDVPCGVQLRYREPANSESARFNDVRFTLVDVRRTQGTVVANGERYRIDLDKLQKAGEQQAEFLLL